MSGTPCARRHSNPPNCHLPEGTFRSIGGCRLLAQSGHPKRAHERPLSGVKRTSQFKSVTSAFDPKRTSITAICGNAQLCAVDVVALLSPRALRYIFMWSIFMCFIGVGEASAGQSSRYRTSNTTAAYTKV